MFFISAKIDRPWKFDPKTKRPITVNEVIDTNMLQYAKGPSDSKNKEVGCLCCKGPLHLDGNILWFLFYFISLFNPWNFSRKQQWTLRKKFPYSEFFWSVFSRFRTAYGDLLRIHSKCGKITDRINYEYRHFSRNGRS